MDFLLLYYRGRLFKRNNGYIISLVLERELNVDMNRILIHEKQYSTSKDMNKNIL